MKKVLFLLFTCLLLASLLIPACGKKEGGLNIPPGAKTFKVGIIGPMNYLPGRQEWLGAVMATEKINAAGGVKVGADTYYIDLIKSDSNELNSITDASTAMEKLITVDKADFLIGGMRTEAVAPMQEIAMDNKKIFLGTGAATATLCANVKSDYNRYKYWFRVSPFVAIQLVDMTVMEVATAAAVLKEDSGIKRKLKAAICAEGAQWADSMVGILQAYLPRKLNMEVVGTWRPSQGASELTAEMTAIQAANADLIVTYLSGAVGIPYGRSWGELKVPAASVGINVEAQSLGYWEATKGFGNYDTTTAQYSPGVDVTPLTKAFTDEFMQRDNEWPTYNGGGAYDAIYLLVDAITRTQSLDADVLVPAIEQTNLVTTVANVLRFTGMDAPLGNPHDPVFGPDVINTGVANQWQDGKMVGIWPNPELAYASVAAGYPEAWKNVSYPGVVRWKAPPLVLEKLKAEAAKEPAEVTPPTPPVGEKPPPGGATSFEAATYTNDKLGFSFQYPKDWEEDKTLLTTPYHVTDRRVSSFVPVVVATVWPADAPVSADWFNGAFGKLGVQDFKLKSDLIDDKTADGAKATRVKCKYVTPTGYEATTDAMVTDKGSNRIMLHVYTVEPLDPYNEALHLEVLHTLK